MGTRNRSTRKPSVGTEGFVFDFNWSPPLPKSDYGEWLASYGVPIVHIARWNSNAVAFELAMDGSGGMQWEWSFQNQEAADDSLGGWDYTMADAAFCQLQRAWHGEADPEYLRAEARVKDWLQSMFDLLAPKKQAPRKKPTRSR